MTIRRFYDRWPQYNRRVTAALAGLTDEQLAIRLGPYDWPIWAVAGHDAGARTYWLCGILGEPGADRTPFADPMAAEGWEDDLDHPRSAEELVWALESSFTIVDHVLDTWLPERLEEEIERRYGDTIQHHTRASILQRLLTHDAWHAAQISDALAMHGLPDIDLWRRD
ncbi:MAG TPA: DinB family protein [Candidatus Limnocylindrales bacterium]|nr:DinB family protein [Candidatus Limnocylindrales bacterium]